MPTPRTRDGSQRGEFGFTFSLIVLNSFRPIVGTIALSAALACSSCDRPSAQTQTVKPKAAAEAKSPSSAKGDGKKKFREGYAVWYDVPIDSLAKRRAGNGELTAAHNHLRLGTMVRVTHLANGKSVIVRITDRGITKRGASIDLCKPAAEKLGMISEGMARVRIEELPDDTGTDAPDSKATAAHP
jgi:rare lipoprotein A